MDREEIEGIISSSSSLQHKAPFGNKTNVVFVSKSVYERDVTMVVVMVVQG